MAVQIKFEPLLGISTCCVSRTISDGAQIAQSIASLGAKGLEIDYRMSKKTLDQLLTESTPLGLEILSIHAVCPATEGRDNINTSQVHQLTATNENERSIAVDEVISTLQLAHDLSVGPVVIHCGQAPVENKTRELQKLYDNGVLTSDEGARFVIELRIERLSNRGSSFDSLLKSLEKINKAAESLSIFPCLENRYYLSEMPNCEELAVIFLRMEGSKIRYWHDMGHAQAQAKLGLMDHRALLDLLGHVMVGVHLHDVDGYSDHLPPPISGLDSVDFEMIKDYLKPETVRVIEYRGDINEADAQSGFNWLSANGFDIKI